MTTPRLATDPPTVRHSISEYVEHKSAEGAGPERLNLLQVSLPAEPGSDPQHLGELISLLRKAGGLARQPLGSGTRLGDAVIKSIELGRRLPTRAQFDQFLEAPCMDRLLASAEKDGVLMEVEQAPSEAEGGAGSGTESSGIPDARSVEDKVGDRGDDSDSKLGRGSK